MLQMHTFTHEQMRLTKSALSPTSVVASFGFGAAVGRLFGRFLNGTHFEVQLLPVGSAEGALDGGGGPGMLGFHFGN